MLFRSRSSQSEKSHQRITHYGYLRDSYGTLPCLNPPLRKHPRPDREQDPVPQPSRDPQPGLAGPPWLDRRLEPSAHPHSRPSRGMPSPYATTGMRRGLASYSKGRPLVPEPLAWGLERRRASLRHQLPTSASGLGCPTPSAPPLFGSWRKVNLVPGGGPVGLG